MEIRALGPLEVVRDGAPVRLGGTKPTLVLATLLVDAGRVVSADRLELALWGDSPPRSASHALHVHVSSLRNAVGDAVEIETVDSGYRLAVSDDQYDVSRFESLVASATGDAPAEDRARWARQALALWRGRPFGALADEESLRIEVQRLEQLRADAAEAWLSAEIDAGRHAGVVADIEEEIATSPLRERLWRLLMLALYRSGRQAEALRAYSRLRECLGDELGIEPAPESRELETRILLHDASLDPPRSRAGNLPVPPTPLIGRVREIDAIASTLVDRRVVTLHGPPGVGKSHLALVAADSMRDDFAGGVWHVDMGEIDDADLVPSHVARTTIGTDARTDLHTEAIAAWVGSNATLFVLDGCEAVIEGVGILVADLVSRCPELRIVCTSLVTLGIPGEAIVTLDPLDPDREAVDLFLDRARAMDSSFDPTAEDLDRIVDITRRLEGLPLAVELAAARSGVLGPGQILERLDERLSVLQPVAGDPSRRALDAAIEGTLALLPDAVVDSHLRLAVFREGFDLEAAEAVLDDPAVLDHVTEAMRHALVSRERRSGTVRFRMLDAIRQHALGRLEAIGELTHVRHAHASHFRRWMRAAAKGLGGPDQLEWLVRIDAEHGNLRAALGHALESGDSDTALSIAADLSWYWFLRSHLVEGWSWLERVLDSTVSDESIGRVRTLLAAGQFAWEQAVNTRARTWLEEAVTLSERLDSAVHSAWAQTYLGLLEIIEGRAAEGHTKAGRAREMFEAEGHPLGLGFAVFVESIAPLGSAWMSGAPDSEVIAEGRRRLEALVPVATAVGERNLIGHVEWAVGMLSTVTGDLDDALARLSVAARCLIELGNLSCLCHVLDALALARSAAGEHEVAAELVGMVDALRTRIGTAGHDFDQVLHGLALESVQAASVDGVAELIAAGASRDLDEILSLAWGE